MIMLLVREFDNTGKPPLKEGELDRAWFRLANEETNQTIDYSLMKKVDPPDEYRELIPDEENEDAPPFRNELTYLHGVLYLESAGGSNKWVFESYKHCFQATEYKDLAGTLAELYSRAANEYMSQQKQLTEAGSALKRSQEEKDSHFEDDIERRDEKKTNKTSTKTKWTTEIRFTSKAPKQTELELDATRRAIR